MVLCPPFVQPARPDSRNRGPEGSRPGPCGEKWERVYPCPDVDGDAFEGGSRLGGGVGEGWRAECHLDQAILTHSATLTK